MQGYAHTCRDTKSLSARRAWIEIGHQIIPGILPVSLSARRAWIEISTRSQPGRPKAVALRKESVDRNFAVIVGQHQAHASLSARRAWIEIEIPHGRLCPLRSSLSARRAWIEILELSIVINSRSVALRKESVDRNTGLAKILVIATSRSPQGERG